jgi:hypothetical protein
MIMEQKCANCGNGKWRDGVTAITDTCIQCKYVDKEGQPQPSNWIPKVQTNADRIRAMSDDELAEFICKNQDCYICPGKTLCVGGVGKANGLMNWLKQPTEDE